MKRPVELLSIIGVAAVLVGTAGPAFGYEAPLIDDVPDVHCPGPGIAVDENWNPLGPAAGFELLPGSVPAADPSATAQLVSTVVQVASNPFGPGGGLRFAIGLSGWAANLVASPAAPAEVFVPCPRSVDGASLVGNEVAEVSAGAELPKTGASVATYVAVGGGLVLIGAGVTAVARRRSSQS